MAETRQRDQRRLCEEMKRGAEYSPCLLKSAVKSRASRKDPRITLRKGLSGGRARGQWHAQQEPEPCSE